MNQVHVYNLLVRMEGMEYKPVSTGMDKSTEGVSAIMYMDKLWIMRKYVSSFKKKASIYKSFFCGMLLRAKNKNNKCSSK